jgi:hypothetical protein
MAIRMKRQTFSARLLTYVIGLFVAPETSEFVQDRAAITAQCSPMRLIAKFVITSWFRPVWSQ